MNSRPRNAASVPAITRSSQLVIYQTIPEHNPTDHADKMEPF